MLSLMMEPCRPTLFDIVRDSVSETLGAAVVRVT
jgi:hypothetical protein